MPRRASRSLALVGLTGVAATACFVPPDARPQVGLGTTMETRFVHRGMTQVDRPVLQPRLAVALPTTTGDTVRFTARGNVELYNDTGGAWFPNGHAGRFTEIDLIADYQTTWDVFTVRSGVFSYNLPNGLEFPNGERGGTNEVFVTVSANVLEANPYFEWHYDFDEVRGAYYRIGLNETFDLGKGFTLVLDGSLGYASSAQSSWMYGLDESGWADLRGSATVNYQYDERTQLVAGINGSEIVDTQLADWFPAVNVDDDPIWFTFGVNFVF